MARVKKRISIVLVDDAPPQREDVVALIRKVRAFRVQTISAKFEEVAQALRTTRPDLVLLNLARKGRGRLKFAAELHRTAPALPVIIMGLAWRREDVVGLVRAGVAGFIMADAPFDTYLTTVQRVVKGERVLPTDLTNALFVQLRRRRRARPAASALPPVRLSILQARS